MKYTPDFSSRFRILKGGKISLVVSALIAGSTMSFAAPTGGVVTTGGATINQNGSVTTINQSTNKASINWNSFSIAPSETVNFVQPSAQSVTLNRVVGTTQSLIQGAMNANGQVLLINPNGVLFANGSQINVGGLVASTLNITDENFQAGNYVFEGNSQNSIINMGTITANNGYVAMMGQTVQNEGTILATMGNVQMASGEKISLNLNGNSLVKLTIDQGTMDALVENKGLIKADGGQVYLTTQALNTILDGMVNNTGIIEAQSIDDLKGKVILFAHGGTANISGTIDATGGFVETSGKSLKVADGTVVKAKKWLLDPTNVIVDDLGNGGTITAATIEANLAASGTGEIEIQADGGDITVNQAINIHTVDTDEGESYAFSTGGLTLTAGNDININKTITVGPNAYLTLNHGWNGTAWDGSNEATIYGNGGKITFGMNAEKTDFTGKVVFDIHPAGIETTTNGVWINEVEQTIIRDAIQLQAMNDDKTGNYILANDIDLNGVDWYPIGERNNNTDRFDYDFKGSFNGFGHTISNLTINGNFEQSRYDIRPAVGLFGNIAGGANISGVKLSNASVTNTNNADAGDRWAAPTAALVGEARAEYDADNDDEFVAAPTIHNNIVTGSTINSTGTGSSVGAIVGSAKGATISGNAVTTTTLSSANGYSVGGIVGAIYSKDEHRSTVTNSYVSGSTIKSAYGEVGGIVGYMEGVIVDNATVKDSYIYTTGTIQGSYGAGGIVGDSEAYDGDDYIDSEIKNSSVESSTIAAMQDAGGIVGYMDDTKITNSFYDLSNTKIGDKTGVDVATNVAGVITYGGVDNAEFTAWLTGNKATLSAASLLGAAVGGYYSIDNVSDFRIMLALAYDPANKFKLGANITLDAGLYLPVLRGELDGNNKTISALNVSQSYNSYIGLVGRLEGGTVKNLTLNSPTLNGYSYVGGIAGKASQNYEGTLSPTISNVVVNGFNYSHTKEFNVASQHIDVSINNIGAIAGDFQDGTLSNLSASGNIAVDLTANNDGFNSVYAEYIGGLVGSTYRSTLDTASSAVAINVDLEAKAHSNSQAWDDNKVGAYNIGGLIGSAENSNLIKDTTTTGAISIKTTREITASEEDRDGLSDLSSIGGAFGHIGESYIKNATATNTITIEANNGGNYGDSGIREIGGIAGYTDGSFYDTVTTSGTITLTLNDKAWGLEKVGGALGYAEESILKDVDSTRNITTTGYTTEKAFFIGGLVGYADSTNIIGSSYSGTIDLSSMADEDGEPLVYESGDIGGLVGLNEGDTDYLDFASFDIDIAEDVSVEDKTAAKTAALAAYNAREDVIALKALGYTLDDDSEETPEADEEYSIEFSIKTPEMQWGVIKDSTATVNIKAPTASNVGGMVGRMDTEDGGQIINGSVIALNGTSKVEGYSNVGGMVGYNSYGNITDSDAAINVEAKSTMEANVGGLVGYNEGGSSSQYVYPDTFNSSAYDSYEAAQAAVDAAKEAFIAEQLAANPGYEVDYVSANAYTDNNGVANSIQIQLELVKYTPTGVITNSYATGKVTGGSNVGGLVGYNYGEDGGAAITGSHATGAVSGTTSVGGLVGYAEGATIDISYSTGTVNGQDAVGGLVGYATGSEIIDSYHTTGKVTGANGTEGITGGLVGNLYDNNLISGSYATSEVEGEFGVGGLIGSAYSSSVENSYATGKVTATGIVVDGERGAYAGGLAGGFAFGSLSQSYATGEVVANGIVAGGLLGNGYQNESIEESYATGKVTGTSQVGGLIGRESGSTISNVYSSGEVVASGDSVGSLMGQADGTTLTNSYASGKITQTGTGQINVKGLIGNVDASIAVSYYDKTVNSGMADEANYGKSTTELKTLATYTTTEPSWDMGGADGHYPILDFAEDRTNVWMMAEGDLGGGDTPPPPAPEPEQEQTQQQVNNIITTIVNSTTVTPPAPIVLAPLAPQPQQTQIQTQNNALLQTIVPESTTSGGTFNLVGSTDGTTPVQTVSMDQLQTAALTQGVGEIRVPLGTNSMVELVNGGVSLPAGVSQEFYVVDNSANTGRAQNIGQDDQDKKVKKN